MRVVHIPTLKEVAESYVLEHVAKSGGDVKKARGALRDWLEAIGEDFDAAKLKRADGRKVVEHVEARGAKPATARRIMAFGVAALNHAKKEERIDKVPKFQMPAMSPPRLRWLTREEHRALMQQKMSPRLKRFYILAFETGARSEPIIELTWDRVDFAARTIDYRVPGVIYKNKRRVVVPISDHLLPRLQMMYETRKDNYVIGLSPTGKVTSTYNEAVKVMKAAGIKDAVPRHVCRHTFASWLLQGDESRGVKPVSIERVAKLIGDTVAMVERTYGHLTPKHLLDDVNRLH